MLFTRSFFRFLAGLKAFATMGCCSRLWRGRKICLSMRKPHRRLLTWRRHTPSVSPATILLLTGTSEPPCRWHLCFLRLMAWKSQPVRKMRASRSCGLRQGKLQNPRWLNGLENTPLDPAVARESCRLPGGRPDFRSSISTLPASRASRRTAFRCKIMNVRSKILLWPGMTIVFQCDCWGFMDAFFIGPSHTFPRSFLSYFPKISVVELHGWRPRLRRSISAHVGDF